MPDKKRNYLLGYGERLTEKIAPPKIKPSKVDPYEFSDAQKRLAPKIAEVSKGLDSLPSACCPDDETVAALKLHPAYLAKSYFPTGLLREVGLEAIGSRAVMVKPEKTTSKKKEKDGTPTVAPSAEIYISGKRQAFRYWAQSIKSWTQNSNGADELIRVEDVRLIEPEERLKPMRSDSDRPLLEVVLHASPETDFIVESFAQYMTELGADVDIARRIYVNGLCFLPVRAPVKSHRDLAKFSFLRVAREMPRLRGPAAGSATKGPASQAQLPKGKAIDPSLSVAVFDGGIPKDHPLTAWVNRKKAPGIADAVSEFQQHGLSVTSALLFGPIEDGVAIGRPYANVDHYRVLDVSSKHDPQEQYFDVVERIIDRLQQKKYEFVNLSIGPDLPIEDDDVHVWTARLDQLFSDGQTLVCVAAGNAGERDWDSGNARIQAPADAVNVLSVGACDSLTSAWKRASYSSVGPGRNPGRVKPDVVSYGGTEKEPFWVVAEGTAGAISGIYGTSFAAPSTLRSGLGIRATLGAAIQPLAVRALLIHHAEDSTHEMREIGWGRIPTDINDLITCEPGSASIVYQGRLEPGKYVRAPIPLPEDTILGTVTIKATFCFASETDPKDPLNYTRAGLEVVLRPHADKRNDPKQQHADSKPFFGKSGAYQTEEELRRDAHKWETSIKAEKNFRGGSLKDAVFDIHYNAREGGAITLNAKEIPYALVVTVTAKKMTDLYDKIANRYEYMLEELKPVIQQQIQIQGKQQG